MNPTERRDLCSRCYEPVVWTCIPWKHPDGTVKPVWRKFDPDGSKHQCHGIPDPEYR